MTTALAAGRIHPLVRWTVSLSLWLGMGFSLGWYYTFTYYGRAGWPMPLMEVCAAIILYYFSVLNVDTEIQAIHWMIAFPIAGILWSTATWSLAPRFGITRPILSRWCWAVSLSALPIVLAGPPMALFAARTDAGLSVERMIDVALRRGIVSPPDWLTPLYITLALIGLGWQAVAYRRAFQGRRIRSVVHVLVSAIAVAVMACVVGATVALPLRLWLE